MLNKDLTSTPQEIANSANGVFIYPAEFMYAFGTTQPTVGAQWEFNRSNPLDYGGAYGSI